MAENSNGSNSYRYPYKATPSETASSYQYPYETAPTRTVSATPLPAATSPAVGDSESIDSLKLAALIAKAKEDIKTKKTAEENLKNRSSLYRGLLRGIDSMQATYEGGVGLLQSAIGNEDAADERMRAYQEQMRQASENPTSVQSFFSTDEKTGAFGSINNFGEYIGSTIGAAAPSLAEAALSAAAGSAAGGMLVPGPDPTDIVTVPVGGIAGLFSKAAVKKAISEVADQYVKKGIAKEVAQQRAEQAVKNTVAKKVGAAAGAAEITALHEGGGIYAEGREKGYDNPVSALLLGQLSGASEAVLGNVPAGLRTFIGRSAVPDVARKQGVAAAAGFLWDTAKNATEEGVQEGFQEFLNSANEEINDPKSKLFSKENFMKWAEAGAAGAVVGGVVGAGLKGVDAGREVLARRPSEPLETETKTKEPKERIPKLPPEADTSGRPDNIQSRIDLLDSIVNNVESGVIDPKSGEPQTVSRTVARQQGLIGGKDNTTDKERLSLAKQKIVALAEGELKKPNLTDEQRKSLTDVIARHSAPGQQKTQGGTVPPVPGQVPTTSEGVENVRQQTESKGEQGIQQGREGEAQPRQNDDVTNDEERKRLEEEVAARPADNKPSETQQQTGGTVSPAAEAGLGDAKEPFVDYEGKTYVRANAFTDNNSIRYELLEADDGTSIVRAINMLKAANDNVVSVDTYENIDKATDKFNDIKKQLTATEPSARKEFPVKVRGGQIAPAPVDTAGEMASTMSQEKRKGRKDEAPAEVLQPVAPQASDATKVTPPFAATPTPSAPVPQEKSKGRKDEATSAPDEKAVPPQALGQDVQQKIANSPKPPEAGWWAKNILGSANNINAVPSQEERARQWNEARKAFPIRTADQFGNPIPEEILTKRNGFLEKAKLSNEENKPRFTHSRYPGSVFEVQPESLELLEVNSGRPMGDAVGLANFIEKNTEIKWIEETAESPSKAKPQGVAESKKEAQPKPEPTGDAVSPEARSQEVKNVPETKEGGDLDVQMQAPREQKQAERQVAPEQEQVTGKIWSPDSLQGKKVSEIANGDVLTTGVFHDTSQLPEEIEDAINNENILVESGFVRDGKFLTQEEAEKLAPGITGGNRSQEEGIRKRKARLEAALRVTATGQAPVAQPTPSQSPQGLESTPASSLQAKDSFTDSQGQRWLVHISRNGVVIAHPVVDGKAQVNKDSGVPFAISEQGRIRNPEYRTDIQSVEKWTEEADSKPVAQQSVAPAVSREQVENHFVKKQTNLGASEQTAKQTAKKTYGRIWDKIRKSPWKTITSLQVKGRGGVSLGRMVRDKVTEMKNAGFLTVAWDRDGNPHYALPGTQTPDWLTETDTDAARAKLPAKPSAKDKESQPPSTPVAEQAAPSPAEVSKESAQKEEPKSETKEEPKPEAKQEEKESSAKTYLTSLSEEELQDLAAELKVKATVDEILNKVKSKPAIREYLETAAAEARPLRKKKRRAAPRNVEEKNAGIPRNLKTPQVREVPSNEFNKDERKQERILEKIGFTLRLTENGNQKLPGWFIAKSRTIWLDRDYLESMDDYFAEQGRPEKSMTWGLFAHEMFHAIKRSSPKAWRSLYNWVGENDPIGLGKAKVAYLADMKKVNTGYYERLLKDEDLLNDEGLSRYLEDRAAYFKFWNDLGKANPGLLARIGRWIRRVLRFAEPGSTDPDTLAGQTRLAIERAMKRHNIAMKGKGGRRAAPARTGKQTKIAVRGERRVVRGMTPQQVDDLDRIIKKKKFSPEDAAELEKLALDKLERFPTTGTGEEPWSEAEIRNAGFIKSPKTGKRKPFISFAGQPYTFHLNPETGKAFTKKKDDPAKRAQYVAKMGDRLVEIVDEITSEAEKGQEWAKEILRHKTWYSAMTTALRKHYVNADLFADLLGALSPITKVKDNWNFALDAIGSFVRGDYDVALKAFSEHLNSGGTVSNYEGPLALRNVTYIVEKEKTLNAIISKKFDIKTSKDLAEYRKLLTEANPEVLRRGRKLKEGDVLVLPMKFGTNTKNAMKAMLDLWRILEPGQAPKAKQFSANIIGASHGATIDVWAARLLQRIARQLYGGNLRIPILAEMGVQGVLGPDLKAGGAFGMGQDIFAHAAKKLGMNPDDLQAIVWFYEKRHWTEKNWTSEEGEGGSLDDQHQELDPDRYIVGGTVERPDFKPTASQLREAFAGAWRTLVDNTDVLIAKAEPTLGRYSYFDKGELVKVDERSMDFEFTVRPEFSPAEVLSEVARIAQESGQDAVLVSRVLDDFSDSENARPGVELAFSRPATEDEVKAIIDEVNKTMPETGFTFVVDPRHAGSDMPKQFVGLRFQYVPEFDKSNRTKEMTDVLHDLAIELRENFQSLVRASQVNYYDSVLLNRGNYDDYRAGTAEAGFGKVGRKRQGRQPVREGSSGADRSVGGVSESDSGTALPSGSDTDVEGRDSGRRYSPGRRGDARYDSRSQAPLDDAPKKQGATGPDRGIVQAAERYARSVGIDLKRQAEYVQVDEDRARRIAQAFEDMTHSPNDPAVKEAYDDLIRQTKAQYDALVKAGYTFTFYDGKTDPYNGNPYSAVRDLRQNKTMAVYGTYDGYGTEGITDAALEDNPMLADTGLRWKDQNGVLHSVVANDLFRAVHDAFGHSMEGAGFRARGEENAWQAHVRLYYGPAIGAMTSETRGQNSWLNFGPYGEKNKTAGVLDTVFADQKTGLMPEWTWTEGRAADMEETGDEGVRYSPRRKKDATLAGLYKLLEKEGLIKPQSQRTPSGEGETTGTKNVKTNELRARMGLGDRVMPPRESEEQWQQEAARLIAKDPGYPARLAEELRVKPRPITPVEEAVLNRHIRKLANRRLSKDVVDDVLTAVEASEQVGRIWGQTGRSRQIELESDFSIAGIIRRHLRDVQQRPTEEQLQEYAELAERYKKLEEDNKKLVEELAKETIARKKAEAASQPEPEKPKLGTKRAAVVKKVADAFSVFQNLWSGGNRPAAGRNLQPITETPEFKRWFGDSKVVDEDGKPLVVYHGTSSRESFSSFDNPYTPGWEYFTDTAQYAGDLALVQSMGRQGIERPARTYPVFLKITNPLDVRGVFTGDLAKADEFFDYLESAGIDVSFKPNLEYDRKKHILDHVNALRSYGETARNAIQKAGYDGLIFADKLSASVDGRFRDTIATTYLAFEPTQIKSATGNRGTFDPTNPDIRYSSSRQPNDIKAAANNVVSALREAGVSSILELEAQIKANLLNASPEQIQAIRDAWNESIAKNKIESPIGDNPTDSELGARAKELMRAAIELGYGAEKENWMDVVDVVYEQLSNEVPGVSKYETMQAMSDYGVWQSLNTEPVEVIIRAIRGKARQSLKIEDTIAAIKQSEEWLKDGVSPEEVARRLRDKGLLPKATGQERATPDSIERELISQFNKLKKTLPVPAESKEGQLKSALTTAKTAANNRLEILVKDIAALDEAIKNRKELVKPVAEKTALEPDEELAGLREQLEQKRRVRDKLKADYEKIFPPTKPKRGRKPLTEEQRLDASVRMLERQISAVKADVKALEDGTWAPAAKNPELTSERKEELMAELRSLRQLRKVALEANPVYQATEELKYWQRYRKSQERRLAFWQRRLEEAKSGRIPVPLKKRTITEKAILEKNMEIEEVQYDAMIAIEKAKRATWNTGQWIGQGLLEATSLIPKTLMLGMEMSFVLRQGFFYTYSQPMKSFYALMEAIPAVFSQRLALESEDGLKNRPNAKEYELAKVDFTQVTGPQAKLEELYQSAIIRWLENTETKLLLPLRTWAKLYAMAERGNRTFSNIMKADMYDIQKRDTLAAREFFGVNTGWTEDDIKETGRIANIFSGRGTGLKDGNPWLDWLFLARRWTWSRIQADFIVPFQLVTPQWIGQWNADRGMRIALAKLYIQAMVGHTAKMAAAYVAYRLLAGDDEEEMPTFEFDLRSSDAMAMKIGETRFKDEGGLMPAVVLASRILTGKMKTSKGEIKSIYGDDVQYGGKTAADFIINYGRYKLGTAPSAILEWASGRDAVGNVIEDKDDPTAIYRNIVGSRITPLTYREIYAAESELGLKRGTLAALEAFFGVSVSTHGDRTKYKKATEEQRKKQFKKDLESMEYDTLDFAYKDLLTDSQRKQMLDTREMKKEAVVYAALASPPQRKNYKSEKTFEDGVADHEKAVANFGKMELDFNDARLMLSNYYKRQYGSAYEMRGGSYVMRQSYAQRLQELRKLVRKP